MVVRSSRHRYILVINSKSVYHNIVKAKAKAKTLLKGTYWILKGGVSRQLAASSLFKASLCWSVRSKRLAVLIISNFPYRSRQSSYSSQSILTGSIPCLCDSPNAPGFLSTLLVALVDWNFWSNSVAAGIRRPSLHISKGKSGSGWYPIESVIPAPNQAVWMQAELFFANVTLPNLY
jgi:hypothetical protein